MGIPPFNNIFLKGLTSTEKREKMKTSGKTEVGSAEEQPARDNLVQAHQDDDPKMQDNLKRLAWCKTILNGLHCR